jgi:hypothetical protein
MLNLFRRRRMRLAVAMAPRWLVLQAGCPEKDLMFRPILATVITTSCLCAMSTIAAAQDPVDSPTLNVRMTAPAGRLAAGCSPQYRHAGSSPAWVVRRPHRAPSVRRLLNEPRPQTGRGRVEHLHESPGEPPRSLVGGERRSGIPVDLCVGATLVSASSRPGDRIEGCVQRRHGGRRCEQRFSASCSEVIFQLTPRA